MMNREGCGNGNSNIIYLLRSMYLTKYDFYEAIN